LVFSIFFLIERNINREKKIILKLVGLFLAAMFVIYCSFIFFALSIPIQGGRDPGSENYLLNMDCFEQVSIPSMNGKIDGWLYKQNNEKAPLIIFFNGAGECSAETVRKFYEDGILSEYFPDYNFLCTDYPSYGFSDGYVSEAAMKEFAIHSYDTATEWDFVDHSNITVIGYSIGTGPASYLAAHRELTSLILLATYDEFWDQFVRNIKMDEKRRDIKKVTTKVQWMFYRLLWSYNVDPYDYAKKVDEPVLIISSWEDITIPHEASMRVAFRLRDCEVDSLSGIKHENLLCNTSYEAIRKFLYK
jgi:pimeloyl-ACP methyl ester carboxylesterase